MSYSRTPFHLTKRDIEHIVTKSSVYGLNGNEEVEIENAILRARGSDERISLFEIDMALKELEREGRISKFDRKHVMQSFEKKL